MVYGRRMVSKKTILFFGILFLPIISATFPGIPHQFYGDVLVNNSSLVSGTVTVERNNQVIATTEILDSKYGYEVIFLVEDIEYNLNGKLIIFYVNGIKATEFIFENGGTTKLDLIIQGGINYCGNGFCQGDETYLNCPEDCEAPKEEHTITITRKSKSRGFIEFCDPNWKCSGWKECNNDLMTRECYDSNHCDYAYNKPVEEAGCDMISQSLIEKNTPNYLFILVIGITIILIIVLIVLVNKV